MPTQQPQPVPLPTSSFPGANPQEGGGRLINVHVEPLGDPQTKSAPAPAVWRRAPGLSLFARTAHSGYRGGLQVQNNSYEVWSGIASVVDPTGSVTDRGSFPGTKKISIAHNQLPNSDVVAVDPDVGAYILNTTPLTNASATATIGGTTMHTGDSVSLTFSNAQVPGEFATVSYTLGSAETTTTVATGLKNAINASTTLAGYNVTASSTGAVVTISEPGQVANQTQVTGATVTSGGGNVTVTIAPASGFLSGGTGTPGITFTGAPVLYNAGGILPQPTSVEFQDGYFIFTTGAGQVYATVLNSLSMNALTFITIQSRADVTLLRGIAFNGLMYFFTTGGCEVWQDVGNAPPAFPYNRYAVLDVGLLQSGAIAGYETGFAELLWVDQTYSVQWLTQGQVRPQGVSPPDLDRLIEAEHKAGNILEAGCYVYAGKKYWHLSSPHWSWEFNINDKRWNERWSLLSSGIYGRWRAMSGHPAFGKFLLGDAQSGNLLFIDDQNYTEVGAPLLWRVETGPVKIFPHRLRVARSDVEFDMGVGQAVGNFSMVVTGAAASPSGAVRLLVKDTSQARSTDVVQVTGVTGTVEANGTWPITVVDATHIDLNGSVFANAYVSGGVAVDITSPPQAVAPQVAISWSHDGGVTFGNPLLRQLGQQGQSKRSRASVKNLGQSGPQGTRYRYDITDPVYVGLLGATQSSDPRTVGA